MDEIKFKQNTILWVVWEEKTAYEKPVKFPAKLRQEGSS